MCLKNGVQSQDIYPRPLCLQKQKPMCPWSIAGVPFDLAGCFRAFPHTTFLHFWRNWNANCVVAIKKQKQKEEGRSTYLHPRRCKTSSVGQSAGLSIPRSSVRIRQNSKNENSNLHGFEVHRLSSKGTQLLFQVIKAIMNQKNIWSAIAPGFCGPPHYCAPLVCVPDVMKGSVVWRYNKPKTKNQKISHTLHIR